MPFFAASEAPPRPESMKFPVFSLLAGNLAFSETSSQLTPPSSGEAAANLTSLIRSQSRSVVSLAGDRGLVEPVFEFGEVAGHMRAVLARPKFAFPSDEIAAVLAMFRSQGELVLPEASAATSSGE